eukprot:833140-Pyramimonas_sp.AAC.1
MFNLFVTPAPVAFETEAAGLSSRGSKLRGSTTSCQKGSAHSLRKAHPALKCTRISPGMTMLSNNASRRADCRNLRALGRGNVQIIS